MLLNRLSVVLLVAAAGSVTLTKFLPLCLVLCQTTNRVEVNLIDWDLLGVIRRPGGAGVGPRENGGRVHPSLALFLENQEM